MGARTKARKRALDILFESEQRGLPAAETLSARQEAAETPLNPYTVTLVEGVDAHRAEIDEFISSYSSGWPINRMPAVDRTIIRIGVYELRHVDEVPNAVAMSEAVSLARELSTDESPSFVNGVLARIAQEDFAQEDFAPEEVAPEEVAQAEVAPEDIVPEEVVPAEVAPEDIAQEERAT